MKKSLLKIFTALLLCVCLLPVPPGAKADSLQDTAAGAAVVFAAPGPATSIVNYFRFRSITGCTATSSGDLTLFDENAHLNYNLSGEIASIKPGERVHVYGKKQKNPSGPNNTFIVNKLVKDYGSCKTIRPKSIETP